MRFVGLALLFVSFSSLACPNLTGTYARCASASGQSSPSTDLVVAQSVSNGITSFTISETDEDGVRETSTLVADGVARTETDDSSPEFPMTSVTTNSCQGDSVISESVISTGGQEIGSVTVTVRRQGAALVQIVDGMIMGAEISDTITCQ